MTKEEVLSIIERGEGIRIEFKECRTDVPDSFYDTVCSFSNKEGGIILLGVSDAGEITGVEDSFAQQCVKNIITCLNDPSLIDPPITITPIPVNIDGAIVVAVKLSVSSQVHKCRSVIYDREDDIDLRITDDARIKEIYFRKRQVFTETQIYKFLTLDDLNPELFQLAKDIIRKSNPAHPWLGMDAMALLRSAALYRKDFQTGEEGLTLAAALLFGKDETIQSILPAYKVEAMVRVRNTDRWDDRINPPLRTNLIQTYISLMDFVRKHLPGRFFIDETGQRVDIRELIFREIVGNIIVHREYTNAIATELIITKTKVQATNPNRAMFHGPLDVQAFSPYAKNPTIRKFFTAFGWTDEIGSGVRNVVKYLKHYTPGGTPLFYEDDVFRTEVPLEQSSLADIGDVLKSFLQLEECTLSGTEKLNQVPLSSDLDGANPDQLMHSLVLGWHEQGTRMISLDWMLIKDLTTESWQKVPGWSEKGTKFLGKKGLYLMQLLVICLEPASMDEMLVFLKYNNRSSFRDRYILPLLGEGLIERTIPEKPSSKFQRYKTSLKGKLLLGGTRVDSKRSQDQGLDDRLKISVIE